MIQAVEFFSGIGAFAVAAHSFKDIEVVAVYDQSENANHTYKLNFGRNVNPRNLDGIKADEIPTAQLWWLSPPCTPYSVRGNRRDAQDPRAQSFLNLTGLIESHYPRYLAVENVLGFVGSQVHEQLLKILIAAKYNVVEFDLCSTMFGVPMRRPRHFVLASQDALNKPQLPEAVLRTPLREFVEYTNTWRGLSLLVAAEDFERYGESYHMVDERDDSAIASCFTAGYGKSQRSSGSYLQVDGKHVRRFSPDEILWLLGFPGDFQLPTGLTLSAAWRLVGNSVDTRCIQFCLRHLISHSY